jgi:hypothetical protein
VVPQEKQASFNPAAAAPTVVSMVQAVVCTFGESSYSFVFGSFPFHPSFDELTFVSVTHAFKIENPATIV